MSNSENFKEIMIDDLIYRVYDNRAHLAGPKLSAENYFTPLIRPELMVSPKLTIPSHVCDLPVTSIDAGAFANSNLEEISLPDTIEFIGSGVFQDCTKLKKINIPKNLTEIDSTAFACCKIDSVTIPGNVRLHSQAFYGCGNLHTVMLKEGIESLPLGIFTYCGIKHIFLPDSLKEIKYEALMGVDKNMIIHCSKGSFAEKWAKEHGYQVQHGRTSLTEFLNETLTNPTVVK